MTAQPGRRSFVGRQDRCTLAAIVLLPVLYGASERADVLAGTQVN